MQSEEKLELTVKPGPSPAFICAYTRVPSRRVVQTEPPPVRREPDELPVEASG